MRLNPLPRRAVPALALTTLLGAAPFLAAPASHSAPTFTEADMDGYATSDVFTPGCTAEHASTPPVYNQPVAANGAATTDEQSSLGTITSTADPSDVVKVSTTLTGRARVASAGQHTRLVEIQGTGRVAADSTKPVSSCQARSYSYQAIETEFTLSRPTLVTIGVSATPFTYVEASLWNDDDAHYLEYDLSGEGTKLAGEHTVVLPPGKYWAILDLQAWVRTARSIPSRSVSATLRARFDDAGSRTSAPVGKGARFVGLPSARSCPAGTLDVAVTSKRKRAARIAQVKYVVNGKVVRVVRKPAKGKVTRLAVPATSTADVRAVVTERKRQNGRPGKVSEVRADYAPCS